MHDVIRDVAIFIASSKEKQLIRCGDKSHWISTFFGERNELSNTANFLNLRLLLIQGDKWEISDKYFKGAINLNVLSMSGIYSLKSSLPRTIILLKGLRTLILDDMRLETITVVGDLENLEIFICRDCPYIKMLPVEIGRLVRLKLLEFSKCRNLKRVAPGVISSLIGLENLKMIDSFNGWEAERSEGKERTNAALSEIQSLSSLTCLTIEVEDSRLVAEHFKLPRHVEKYEIFISSRSHYYLSLDLKFDRKMCVYLAEKEMPSGNWFAECISRVECMSLKGEGSNIVDLRQVHQNIRKLSLEGSSAVKKLVNMTSSICSTATVFPQLELLRLIQLSNLEEICHIDGPFQDGSSIDAFHNLKTLYLYNLPALKHWWKSSPYQHNAPLPQLQRLTFHHCMKMEQVFLWTEEKNEKEIGTILFPMLKYLKLSRLPSLTSFSKGIYEGVGFPLLTEVEIEECPQLKSLVSNYHDEDEDSSHLFSKLVVSSDRLERFVIRRCGKIKSLFSSSIGQNLRNINEMIINDCEEMIKVFEDDKGKTSRVFPKLQELEMIALPKLKEFCESAQMEFPLLREVSIMGCPEMKRLSSGSVSAPNLKALRLDFKGIAMSTGQDLNAELQQHLSKAKEEESFYKWVLKIKGMERMGDLWSEFVSNKNRLELSIIDSTQAAEQISFPSDIGRYTITICTTDIVEFFILSVFPEKLRFNHYSDVPFDRELRLRLPREIIIGNWIHDCVRSVEDIWLKGDGAMNLDLGRAQNMRRLTLTNSSVVKKLMNITPPGTTAAPVFPHLEMLDLLYLSNLEEICPEGSSVNVFNNLKQLHAEGLPVLKHLWKSNSPNPDNASILQLECLSIHRCEMIEQVLLWSDGDEIELENRQTTITFRNLMDLTLWDLPRLKAVCNGIRNIEFPRLSSLQIRECPQLKSAVSIVCSAASDDQQNSENARDQNTHFLCNSQKVAFGGLKELKIGGCKTASSSISNSPILWCATFQNHDIFARLERLRVHDFNDIRSLFSSSVVRNLSNLLGLTISSCAEMVKVIEDDDYNKETDASCEMSRACVFPKLQDLEIQALPKLEMFCRWKSCALHLPSLISVRIDACPEMKIFSMGSFTAPYQVTVKIDGKEVINHTKELNVMLQQPVFREDLEE